MKEAFNRGLKMTIENYLSSWSPRRFIAPRSTLERSDFRSLIRFSWLSYSSRRQSSFPFSMLLKKSQRLHPSSVLMETVNIAIVWDSSIRFPAKTFLRMMARTVQYVIASGLPMSERTLSAWKFL
jgi:hypothetical protein